MERWSSRDVLPAVPAIRELRQETLVAQSTQNPRAHVFAQSEQTPRLPKRDPQTVHLVKLTPDAANERLSGGVIAVRASWRSHLCADGAAGLFSAAGTRKSRRMPSAVSVRPIEDAPSLTVPTSARIASTVSGTTMASLNTW